MKQKQAHKHGKEICGCQGGKGWQRQGVKIRGLQMQTTVYEMEKQ